MVANNMQVDKDGNIFSFGGSFYEGEIPAPSELRKRDLIDPVEALKGAVNTLQLPVEADKATAEPTDVEDSYVLKGTSGAEKDPKAQLMYIQQDGQLKLTFRVETDILSNWLLSYVDASNKDVHAVVSSSDMRRDLFNHADKRSQPLARQRPKRRQQVDRFQPPGRDRL